jgi:hypothetical protein
VSGGAQAGPDGSEPSGVLADVVRLGSAAAGRVAGWLRLLGLAALAAGLLVCVTLVVALVDEGGGWRFVAVVVTIAALAPAVLVAVNRRRLLGVTDHERELHDELRGLAASLGAQARSMADLVALRDELRGGGVRALVHCARRLRGVLGVRQDTLARTDALRSLLGLAGFGGLGAAVGGSIVVLLAAPVAVVAASVVWVA